MKLDVGTGQDRLIPRIGKCASFQIVAFSTQKNDRVSRRGLQHLAGTRVKPAPSSKYVSCA